VGLGPTRILREADSLLRDQPLLAELYTASVQGRRISVGPRAGNSLWHLELKPKMEAIVAVNRSAK